MAASARRKQEEKQLKTLREMTSLPPNRSCSDCGQRGPTYANMTVGSFACTSCSGILRGLNPPHRVKSISMTTFTQQEIDFLQKYGNEVCRQIWLGLYDDRTSTIPDFREPQKVKEFLQEKYEKKRWYVPPNQAKVVASISGSSASSTSSTPEVRPLRTLLGDTAPVLHISRSTPSQESPIVSRVPLTQQDRKFDLFSDFGSDIFGASPSQSTGSTNFANFAHFSGHPGESSELSNANFADFDNFSRLTSAESADFQTDLYGCSKTNGAVGGATAEGSSVPLAGRYAALADLDNAFSTTKSDQGLSGASSAPPSAAVSPPLPETAVFRGDRYAALVALDNVFSTSSSNNNSFNTATCTPGAVFGASTAQPQQGSMSRVFPGPTTNPFVSATAPQTTTLNNGTNPFRTNGRTVAGAGAASFGPGSMSMPAGFGNAAAYNIPSSFSGSFQQAFPGQGFPPPQIYPQNPNGGGFTGFTQGKAVVTPSGQNMASIGVTGTNNPFLARAPMGQHPAGNTCSNPFL